MSAERTATVFLGDAEIPVRFDFQGAEPAVYNPIEKAHPGCEAEVTINALQINGEWVGTEFFESSWLDAVEQKLLEDASENDGDERAEYEARDRFIEGYDA